MTDYGPLGPLVGLVGSVAAAGVAIALAWRGRSKWEPSEQDIDHGPQRVGGLAGAVAVALIYVGTRPPDSGGLLQGTAILMVVVCVLALLAYSFVTSTQTYEDRKNDRKIIGGFALLGPARARTRRANGSTVQEYFADVAYDPDRVWPRGSRAAAKLLFVALYLALTISGTIAIATTAILVEKSIPSPTLAPSPPAASASVSPTTSASPTASPSASPTPPPTSSPSPTSTAQPTVTPPDCTVDNGGFVIANLSASQPAFRAIQSMCLAVTTLVLNGPAAGSARVTLDDGEILTIDLDHFDSIGTEGAGSGERQLEHDPPIGVVIGQTLALDVARCTGCENLTVHLQGYPPE